MDIPPEGVSVRLSDDITLIDRVVLATIWMATKDSQYQVSANGPADPSAKRPLEDCAEVFAQPGMPDEVREAAIAVGVSLLTRSKDLDVQMTPTSMPEAWGVIGNEVYITDMGKILGYVAAKQLGYV